MLESFTYFSRVWKPRSGNDTEKIMGSREGWVGGGLGGMGKDREGTHSGCQDSNIILVLTLSGR